MCRRSLALLGALLMSPLLATADAPPGKFGDVSLSRLREADKEPDQWLSNGRDANATFYSPVAQITPANASHLGFAWQYKTDTFRGMEATPQVIDGVMYLAGNWGKVYALDATSGKPLWTFDPHTDALYAKWALVDVITRSLAVWKGRVYTVGTDCRLSALDAHTGQLFWQTTTLADEKAGGYACDGAPQIAGQVIVVGNSGGENLRGGSRGYVSAFDADTGKLAWRFFTVPSLTDCNPSVEMQRAAQTWDPRRDPAFGGGGNAWGLMTYDPDLDLIYFGTGNAAPWNAGRDWSGGKSTDRLYAASIIALHGSSGRMAWHYQTTPGDVWDFDATMNLVLATLKVDGKSRHVLMQANKNGYFYVIDRATGEPLSAKAFVYMNWSSGVDSAFRPIVNPAAANYDASPKIVYPSAVGAHSWQPMSYSPSSGLVYIPAIETGNIMIDVKKNPGAQLTDVDGQSGVELLFPDPSLSYDFWKPMVGGNVPHFSTTPPDGVKPALRSVLIAWDPIAGRTVWQKQTSQDFLVMDGGALSTAGGVVFAGREDGTFVVYDAKSGNILKVLDTGTPIMAAPMTYRIAGRQYVAVQSGHGGQYMTFLGTSALKYINEGRVLVFALDGTAEVPKPQIRPTEALGPPPPRSGSATVVAAGRNLFFNNCAKCHTLGAPGITPDLTRSNIVASESSFKAVLLKGALMPMGMPRFSDKLTAADADALRSFFIDQWWQAYDEKSKAGAEPQH